MKIDFQPHLESFMFKQKSESKFFKKNCIQHPNGVLTICKLPFPNGSYRNGVWRALWAMPCSRHPVMMLYWSSSTADVMYGLTNLGKGC